MGSWPGAGERPAGQAGYPKFTSLSSAPMTVAPDLFKVLELDLTCVLSNSRSVSRCTARMRKFPKASQNFSPYPFQNSLKNRRSACCRFPNWGMCL